ncbi:DUF4906 domain-containing protein [Parabacteroides sp.]
MKTDWLKRQRDWLAATAAGCLLLLSAGCTDSFDTLTPQGNMTLRLVAASLDEQPATRAVNDDVKEDELTHLWVLQFDGTADGSTLVGKVEYTKADASLTPDNQLLSGLITGTGQRLVFVANAPDALGGMSVNSSTYSNFKSLSLTVTDEKTLFDATTRTIPMTGNWTGEIKSSADGSSPITATIQMERIVSKISLKVQQMIPDGELFALSSVRLHNVPGKMYLSKPSGTVFPAAADVTLADYGDSRKGALPLTTVWYMPENCRGTGTATLSTDKTAANLNAAVSGSGDKATWLEIIGDYTIGNETYAATYYSYLGGNSTDDYNLRRNSAYDITITIRGRNTSDSRVKLYGDAYTMVVNPDDADNSPNTLPIMGAVRNIRQTGKTQVSATATLSVDGKAAGRGFVYSSTVSTDIGLRRKNSGVTEAFHSPGTSGFTSEDYTAALTGLALNTTYYVRAVATSADGTKESYGPITSFKTLAMQPAANCFMVQPGASVMFETKDAIGGNREIDAISLSWQTRDDGTETGQLPVTSADNLIFDATNNVVIVHTNPEAKAGNVLLDGKKAGATVWGWHLWVTRYNPTGFTISGANKYVEVQQGRVMTLGSKYIAAYGNKAIMDRELGSQATITLMDANQIQNSNDLLYGTYYFAKSRIPFAPLSKTEPLALAPLFNITGTKISAPAVSDTTSREDDFWGNAGNPCPAGWKVPSDEAVFEDLQDYAVLSAQTSSTYYKGWMYVQGGVNAWFLVAGFINTDTGKLESTRAWGELWIDKRANEDSFKGLMIKVDENIPKIGNLYTRFPRPIRCVQK